MQLANDIFQAVTNGIECAAANLNPVTIEFNGKQVRLEPDDTNEGGVRKYYEQCLKDYERNGDEDSRVRCQAAITRLKGFPQKH